MAVSGALHQIFRFVFCYACVFYCVNNFILKPARLKAKQAQAQAAPAEAGEVQRVTRPPHVNAWPRGSKLALQLYLSDGAHFERPHLDPSAGGAAVVPATDAAAASRGLVATAEGLVYGAADEADCSHTVSLTLEPTYELRSNRSQLWLHAYVSVVPPPGIATVPAAAAVTEAHVPLVRQQKVRRKSSTKRLLSGEEAGGGEVEGGDGAGGGQGNPPGGHALPSTSADPAPDHAAAPDHEAAPDDRAAPAEGGGGGSAGREVALGGSGDGEAASGGGGGGGGGAESSLIDVMRVLHSTGTGEFDVFPHWAGGAVRLDLLSDFTSFPPNGIPPQMRHALRVEPATGAYTPPLYVNELWSLRSGMPRLNASTGSLNLTVSVAPTSLVKWQLGMQMTQSLEMQAAVHGDEMVEEMRRMLLETNPWLLGLTMAVSLLHSLFDFLAFKNDVQFWRDNKSMKGISLNSLLINLFIQAVIFLYLLDSDTSWVILLSNGVGLLIEAWKLRKIVKSVALRWPAGSWRPRLQLTAADSYVLSDTKAHDEEAMAYLGRVIAPLAVGYASYSLLYNEHKSWYSWLLRAVVGCVYSFGFIKMTPQLFINYRLKSTAHMPWKTFMYKALNTFVDDLFAFVITMPTMHRLSCLRDDLIFVVYLYQRWTYGVDSRRANEFGQVGEEEGSEALPAPPQAPGSTAPVDADGKPKAE